jgi:pimeloyl-ACP methyl ester carboxylesterase
MKEIELLCRHGYRVLSYDHTGCMESQGAHTNGFSQSLADLHAALQTLEKDPAFSAYTFSVVGHSWGGFSCLNIAALHPEITHVVAISGFLSAEQILKQTFGGVLRPYYRRAYALERESNPDFVEYRAEESLRNFNGRVLVIHSADDRVVHSKSHFRVLRKALGDRENVRFLEVQGKGHNPNYTEDAVRYKDSYLAELKRCAKSGGLSNEEAKQAFVKKFDWDRMTAQDDAVWKAIFDTLDA